MFSAVILPLQGKKDCMKLQNKINWPVVKARRALKLKIEEDFRRGWPAPGAFQEKGVLEHLAQADRATTRALMVWFDDGGTSVIAPAEAFLFTWVRSFCNRTLRYTPRFAQGYSGCDGEPKIILSRALASLSALPQIA
jgi:hypothetical protein